MFNGHLFLNMLSAAAEHAAKLPDGAPAKGAFLDFLLNLLSNPNLQAFILSLIEKYFPTVPTP